MSTEEGTVPFRVYLADALIVAPAVLAVFGAVVYLVWTVTP